METPFASCNIVEQGGGGSSRGGSDPVEGSHAAHSRPNDLGRDGSLIIRDVFDLGGRFLKGDFKSLEIKFTGGLLVHKDGHAIHSVGVLIVEGEVLHVGHKAFLGGSRDHSRGHFPR